MNAVHALNNSLITALLINVPDGTVVPTLPAKATEALISPHMMYIQMKISLMLKGAL